MEGGGSESCKCYCGVIVQGINLLVTPGQTVCEIMVSLFCGLRHQEIQLPRNIFSPFSSFSVKCSNVNYNTAFSITV